MYFYTERCITHYVICHRHTHHLDDETRNAVLPKLPTDNDESSENVICCEQECHKCCENYCNDADRRFMS